MKKVSCKRGFTLIELLVVVLIIGILAAVAVPQYKKAVEKARLTELQTMLNDLEHGAELWRLNNNLPDSGSEYITDQLDINYSSLDKQGDYYCTTNGVCGLVSVHPTYIAVSACRWRANSPTIGAPDYGLYSEWTPADGWKRNYYMCDSANIDLSKFGLEQLGFTKTSC